MVNDKSYYFPEQITVSNSHKIIISKMCNFSDIINLKV